ncbi:MAG: hypothetical protein WED11_02605, partial [Natronospirillum sp.]
PSVSASRSPEPQVIDPEPDQPRTLGIEFVQRWWAGDGWLFVDTRARELSESQQNSADRLLASLAQAACGERQPEVTYLIDWPLFMNRAIKHDLEEAQFYIGQKWRTLQQTVPISRLVLLGDLSEELIVPLLDADCVSVPKDQQVYTWQQGDVSCLRAPGTSELLHLPGEKKGLWHVLNAWVVAGS